MKYQPVARIVFQTQHVLQYTVASKSSKKDGFHHVTFKTDGTRDCKCIGHEWLQKKVDDILADCRHKKLVTIYTIDHTPLGNLMAAEEFAKLKSCNIELAWANTYCLQPVFYNPINLYCKSCPLYPEICNIHKIRIPGKRNKLPMIWRLQGLIYKDERTKAAKLLRKIIKEIELLEQ